MSLFVHAVGAWLASEAAHGRFPRPVAIGLAMLVSRLGAPTAILAMGAFAFKHLNDSGAFEKLPDSRAKPRKAPAAADD